VELTREPEGLSLRPARKSKTGKNPRTPSVVSRASRPRPERPRARESLRFSHTRAPVRRLPIRAPRQAVLRTSSWLAPSVSTRPCDLPVKRTRDAFNRLLPPNRTACTRTSLVPGSLRRFRGVDASRRLRLRLAFRGTGRFTTSKTASADRQVTRNPMLYCLTAWSHERGRFLPTALRTIEPLTPLSRPLVHPHASLTFVGAALCHRTSFGRRVGAGRRMPMPPRPPWSPSRESRRFVMIRDVFHR
jgi:hypothetical protein